MHDRRKITSKYLYTLHYYCAYFTNLNFSLEGKKFFFIISTIICDYDSSGLQILKDNNILLQLKNVENLRCIMRIWNIWVKTKIHFIYFNYQIVSEKHKSCLSILNYVSFKIIFFCAGGVANNWNCNIY